MQVSADSVTQSVNWNQMSALELAAAAGLFAVWLALFASMIWFVFKIIRAQLKTPEELAGIRVALRIADILERRK